MIILSMPKNFKSFGQLFEEITIHATARNFILLYLSGLYHFIDIFYALSNYTADFFEMFSYR